MRRKAALRYCLLVVWGNNLSLNSEIGMIPYLLHKDFGYDTMVTAYKGAGYIGQPAKVPGVKIQFIKRIWTKILRNKRTFPWGMALDALPFLLVRAKDIDALTVYHITPRSYVLGLVYRLLNKRGFLQLKVDGWNGPLPKDGNELIPPRYQFLLRLASFDMLSVEIYPLHKWLKDQASFARSFGNICFMPNGVDSRGIPFVSDYERKEDIILHVGRLGTRQKGTEIALNTFAAISDSFPKYRLVLAGPMKEEFRSGYFKKFLQENQKVRERIVYEGYLSNDKLYDLYGRAKILLVPSRWEGSGQVVVEGAFHGDVILGSDIPWIRDVTNDGKLGYLCPVGDLNSFSNSLKYVLSHEEEVRMKSREIQDFVRENYDWQKSLMVFDRSVRSKFHNDEER